MTTEVGLSSITYDGILEFVSLLGYQVSDSSWVAYLAQHYRGFYDQLISRKEEEIVEWIEGLGSDWRDFIEQSADRNEAIMSAIISDIETVLKHGLETISTNTPWRWIEYLYNSLARYNTNTIKIKIHNNKYDSSMEMTESFALGVMIADLGYHLTLDGQDLKMNPKDILTEKEDSVYSLTIRSHTYYYKEDDEVLDGFYTACYWSKVDPTTLIDNIMIKEHNDWVKAKF